MYGLWPVLARSMIKILADTNSLVYIFDNKTDINNALDNSLNAPYKLFTLSGCINELIKIGRPEIAVFVRFLRFSVVDCGPGHVDDELLLVAKKNDMCIWTEDNKLLAKAKEAGIMALRRSSKGRFKLDI